MSVLLIHTEACYFGGAETMLGHYLRGLQAAGVRPVLAVTRGSRLEGAVPDSVQRLLLPLNQPSGLGSFLRQLGLVRGLCRDLGVKVIHGWAARDWELAAAAGGLTRIPAVGTLHDHPRAPFISPRRQRLMKLCANAGLRNVVCVSAAVREACLEAGYRVGKLVVVRNGLPVIQEASARRPNKGKLRIGFLGAFAERKGFSGFFEMLDGLERLAPGGWSATVAGGAQDDNAREMVERVGARHRSSGWWKRVSWPGWIDDVAGFLNELDLLVCPSGEFDPLPTVVLEAGAAGVPVLGSAVGGLPEMIEPGKTGWLFEPGDWQGAARQIAGVMRERAGLRAAGRAAREKVSREFTAERMVAEYLRVYRDDDE